MRISDWSSDVCSSDLIAVGSHSIAPQGRSFHWELWSLVEIGGLSPHSALMAATISAAEGLGVQDDIGSLEVGKIADLVVLDKDPMANIRNTLSIRSEEHTSELQSLMRISYAVFCLKKKKIRNTNPKNAHN